MPEHKVAAVAELAGECVKEVEIDGAKILVGRTNGELFAVSGTCPHYGAPLINGSLLNGRIKCQWHGACFSTKTGDIEDMPGLDSLQCFPLRVEGDDVVITTTPEQLKTHKRRRPMAKLDVTVDKRVFVVIGGGAAGASAVESIRVAGYQGKLVWLMKETTLPVDRPKISKNFSFEESAVLLRPAEFYKEYDIEYHTGAVVTSLNHNTKTLIYQLSSSNEELTLSYDSALVATGGAPMPLRLEGATTSDNIYLLRTLADASRIAQAAAEQPKARVVVVGSNFIGMECAATLSKLVSSVTVVARGDVPFKPFGTEIGTALLRLFEKNNVVFKPNSAPTELKVINGKVTSVVCADGSELPCDFMVCGVGVEIKSTTAFIRPIDGVAEGTFETNGAINVDQHLRVAPGLFAAGDIVKYPDPLFGRVRIEHWAVAGSQGKCAGKNMALESSTSAMETYDTVPYFWTLNFGKGVRYVGHALTWDEIIFDMEPNGLDVDVLKLTAFYIKNGVVIAVATMARDPLASRCAEFMKWKKMPNAETLKAAIKEKGSTNHLFL